MPNTNVRLSSRGADNDGLCPFCDQQEDIADWHSSTNMVFNLTHPCGPANAASPAAAGRMVLVDLPATRIMPLLWRKSDRMMKGYGVVVNKPIVTFRCTFNLFVLNISTTSPILQISK